MAAIGVLLLVVGAIVAFGVEVVVDDFDLVAVGYILMAGGGLALLIAAIRGAGWMSMSNSRVRSERHVSADGHHVVEEHEAT